eukprot:TRINITY_DN77166_c0_g1_i1.p1 TRINITY_DN77166_c0_g1~~TRINITY_DN77166_c0_g1_i1.p1  ORF type:complete len:432 (+),score=48.06 TRINITY_DN77166_c0_g1_i1:42-1337(+)
MPNQRTCGGLKTPISPMAKQDPETAETPALLGTTPGGTASFFSTTVTLINNAVGAGFISLAFCLQQTSVMVGLALMASIGILSFLSAVMIAGACEQTSCFTFLGIVERLFGTKFGTLAQIVMATYACGSCIGYIVLIGDLFSTAAQFVLPLESYFCQRDVVSVLCSLFVLLPLSLLRNLDSLRYSSALALACGIYVTVLVVCVDVERRGHGAGMAEGGRFWAAPLEGTLVAWPVLSVAFTAHYNVPRYYQEMSQRSVGRFAAVAATAFGSMFVLYAASSACGYDTFGKNTEGNLLLNYETGYGAPVFVARLSLAVMTVAAYPLAVHFVKSTIWTITGADAATQPFWKSQFPITSALVVATLLVALSIPKVEVVLGYKGSLIGTFVMYVFPALIHKRLHKGAFGNWALVLAAIGLVSGCLGVFFTTDHLLHG